MKLILTLSLAVGLTASTVAFAQNDVAATDAGNTNAVAADAGATNAVAADAGATNAVVAEATSTNAAAADPAETTSTVLTAPPAQSTLTSNPGTEATIPLIVMDDVLLTDAIRNLARQAALNFMLDPKLTLGQTGPDGKPVAQPTISVRWENVSAQQALTALLNNYNLQITEDPKTRIARITVRDPAAPDPLITRVVQLAYASPTNLLASVQTTLVDKRSKAIADVRTSQIVVLATEREQNAVDELVKKLDTPTKQVLIEARLMETSMNPSTKKGMDWTGTLEAQHLNFGNNLSSSSPGQNNTLVGGSLPKMLFDTAKGFNPATAFLDADGVSAVLSFLNKYAEAKVLSTPRTVTLDNEPASIEVTRASPIVNVTASTTQTTGGSQVTYTNLGVKLHVTPRISANSYVNLRVVPEVSRIFDTSVKTVGGQPFEVDTYDIRKLETHVMIPSGNTLVMGGMVQDDVRNSNTKVPILGDIPILGQAFRSDSKSRQQSNLLIFITPTIVTDGDFQPTHTDFLKNKPPVKDSIEEDWTAWDSGKPKDWSHPDVRPESEKFSDASQYVQ